MNAVEITTRIGCKVLCKYCPQDKLVKAYRSSKKIMTLSGFKKIIGNVNKNTAVIFSGFCEPFLNTNASDMMIYAYNKGFKVELWTTFIGFSKKDLNKLEESKIVFDRVVFHRFKSVMFKNAESVNKFKTFKERIPSLVYQEIKVVNPISRAGNNFSYESSEKNIKCIQNKIESNVVLPDGSLHLCCNDFSLKHRIGNLYRENANSKNISDNLKKINSMLSDNKKFVICRYCECSEKRNMYGALRGDLKVKSARIKNEVLKMYKTAEILKNKKI